MAAPPLRDDSAADEAPALRIAGVPPDVAVATLHATRPQGSRNGSTSDDGRYLWIRPEPGMIVAGDIEGLDNPAAGRMAAAHGATVADFLRFWTLLETVAKIEGTPAHTLLTRYREEPDPSRVAADFPNIEYESTEADRLVITVGWRVG